MCETSARALRRIWKTLDAPTTPWGHVWTAHVPQFLRLWGTLFPFLCHGFEGRWRDLKVEIRHIAHGQWKGASCGFETVLQYSIVRWTLRKLGIALHGRTCKVRKTSSWLWQRYNGFMDQ